VVLHEVANVRIAPSAAVIHRDAVARRIDVTANVAGRDLAAVAADVERGIQRVEFPLEYRAELRGEYAERLAAEERVQAFVIAAAIGIFLLLQACFRSWRLASVVFLSLPMALWGGALVAYIFGGGLMSLGSSLGFVAVLGIAVRNTISLVNRYRYLEREGEEFGAALVQRGTGERSAPVLMTAVTTALVMLPLTLFGDIAGLEILRPMAIVVLGGLITTTLYTLVVVPTTYLLFGADREAELELQPSSRGDEKIDFIEATPARS
jgi:Cu/Ag efflux pump CusA